MNKLHVACPLTTFHEIEALEAAGLKASNLLPKQEELPVDEPPKKDKKARDKSAESKSSKASSKKGKSTTVPTNLAEVLFYKFFPRFQLYFSSSPKIYL